MSLKKYIKPLLAFVLIFIVLPVIGSVWQSIRLERQNQWAYEEIGSTLDSIVRLEGCTEDGWIQKEGSFVIRSKAAGEIAIVASYPREITPELRIKIFVDETEALVYPVSSERIEISFPAEPEKNVTVRFENNFEFQADPPDQRMLSFYLESVTAR